MIPSAPIHQSTQLTITDLISQVGEWATRNFPGKAAPDLGIAEELGEAVHCVLKRFQGIRGFDDPAFFDLHFRDALGDLAIYCLHAAYEAKVLLILPETYDVSKHTDRRYISQLSIMVGVLIGSCDADEDDTMDSAKRTHNNETRNRHIQMVWLWAAMWAAFHGYNWMELVTDTWVGVRERDWQKNKVHAAEVAAQGGVEVPKVVTQAEPGAGIHVPTVVSVRSIEGTAAAI